MATKPTRRRLEPGIFERVDADGARLGLEIYYKDADGKPRRRAVAGGIQNARDELAKARTRRVKLEAEPKDPRVTFDVVADKFEAAHVAGLRRNSQLVYRAALARLLRAFGHKRITAIGKADIRAFVAAERAEGLKANTIKSHLSVLRALYSFAADDLEIRVTFPRLKRSERPDPADDMREHRILTDDEVVRVLSACDERSRLFFRTVAETGARESEALGLTARRIGDNQIAFREQLARGGGLAPLKTRQSKRTIEITRSLAAELRLAGGGERVFWRLSHTDIARQWAAALKAARLEGPQPVIHDLRHTHVSGLIADGWDPVEVAGRIGDTLATTLRVYAHEFDAHRRSDARRAALEARYPGGDGYRMATHTPLQTATDGAKVQHLRTHRKTG
jgi:integrase